MNSFLQQLLIIILMMFLGFYIQELPSSNVLQSILPEWPYVLTLYFSVSSRFFFGLLSAFLFGLIEDVFLVSSMLGVNSLIYVLAAFTLIMTRFRFKHLSFFAQSMAIGLLVIFKIVVTMLFNSILYSYPSHFWVLLSVLTSMLAWPFLHLFFSFFANKHE